MNFQKTAVTYKKFILFSSSLSKEQINTHCEDEEVVLKIEKFLVVSFFVKKDNSIMFGYYFL